MPGLLLPHSRSDASAYYNPSYLANAAYPTGAQSLELVTLVFSDPEWTPSNSGNSDFQRVNSSISFSYLTSFNIRTLSTNSATPGTDVTGLLYTPDLPAGDPCIEASAADVPANVTRQINLPNTDYDLIALAPWISPACTLAYLAAAREDPVRGFLFFLPDNGTSTPPTANSNTWGLGDGGQWKGENKFPVYAIPGQSGRILMQASNDYSGNMTTVPHGHELTETYDPRDYVRLFVDIDTGEDEPVKARSELC